MANFTTLVLQINDVGTGAPGWVSIGGAGTEVRFSDVGTGLLTTASASWPAMLRPGATAIVSYIYAFTADAVGNGSYGGAGGSNPATFSKDNYLQARWDWDNIGTFASAPIFTAYESTAHAAITRNSPSGDILAGNATDTGATARSYLKGNAWGRVTSAGAPAAGPSNAPVVTDGSTGSVGPTAGANWMSAFQGLMGDTDYITAPFTPSATVADDWNIEFALFTGPNMIPATWTPVLSLKYSWS